MQQDDTKPEQKKSEVESFYSVKVVPAFEELRSELEKHGREVSIHAGKEYASIAVKFKGVEEYSYTIKVRISPDRAFPYPESQIATRRDGKSHHMSGGFIRSGLQEYDVSDISKEEIIQDFLRGYELHTRSYD